MSDNETVSLPAPPDLVAHPHWREALAAVRTALSRPRAIVAVLGPPGTGKTLLLRAITGELRAAGENAVLLTRGDADAGPTSRDVPGSPRIVLVDEADRIDLAAVRALLNAGARGIVLAALPAMSDRLTALPGATVVTLRALRQHEATAFIRARMLAVGTPDRLTGDALAELVANGAGIPRLLCGLLTAAEFVASLQGAPTVTTEHVREAVLLRGDFAAGMSEDEETPAESSPAPAPAPAEDTGAGMRGPYPGERWAESAGLATPAPARRRPGLWLALTGAAVAVLVVAYAAKQPVGERLGRQVVALLQGGHPALATSAPPVPVEVVSNQAAAAAPSASNQTLSDPIPHPGPISSASTLPRGVAPHVVLSYHQGDDDAERRAEDVARTLRAAGIAANDPVPVLLRITEPGITYFFAEDQAGAASVSRALGGAFGEGKAVILRQDAPLPRPGTIELQVAPDQAEAAARTP